MQELKVRMLIRSGLSDFSLGKCAAGELVVGREEEPIMIIFRYLSHGNLNESEGARMGSARELLR